MSGGGVPKLRFVRCPKCMQILVEHAAVTVYQCGGCGTFLKAKNRNSAVGDSNCKSQDDHVADEPKLDDAKLNENVLEENNDMPGDELREAGAGTSSGEDVMLPTEPGSSDNFCVHENLIEELEQSLTDDGSGDEGREDDLERDLVAFRAGNELPDAGKHDQLIEELEESLKLSCVEEEQQQAEEQEHMEKSRIENDKTIGNGGIAGDLYNYDVSSEVSNEMFHSTLQSFDSRRGTEQLRQAHSLDSQDFNPIQKFIESQMRRKSSTTPSSNLSLQGDSESNGDRMDQLEKMDDLPDMMMHKLHQSRGIGLLPRRYSFNPSKNAAMFDDPNAFARRYSFNPSKNAVMVDDPNAFARFGSFPGPSALALLPLQYPCLHCYNSIRRLHGANCPDASECSFCSHSPVAGSPCKLHSTHPKPVSASRKRLLRPLSGGIPFTVCPGCAALIQMPPDLRISRKVEARLKCGKCLDILKVEIHSADVPKQSESKLIAESQCSNAAHSGELRPDDPGDGISGDCGVPFTRSFSSGAASAADGAPSGNNKESALHRLMGYDTVSGLLRSRSLDDGFGSPASTTTARS